MAIFAKRTSILVAAALCAVAAKAASLSADSVAVSIVDSLRLSGKATVLQPEKLSARVQLEENTQQAAPEKTESAENAGSHRSRMGYRVEVFADNNVRSAKVQAASRKRAIQSRFPDHKVYLVFEAPFWRVRMGDFHSRAAAESIAAEVRTAFPAMRSGVRVVRSSIVP